MNDVSSKTRAYVYIGEKHGTIVSMKRVLRRVTSFSLIALLAVLNFGIHASLLSQTVHVTGSATHNSNSLSNCMNICTLVALHKDDILDETDKDDDEPKVPFYLRFQSPLVALEKKQNQEARSAIEREPPPDRVPAYIGLTVFRV